jgi:hypothetical protein
MRQYLITRGVVSKYKCRRVLAHSSRLKEMSIDRDCSLMSFTLLKVELNDK